MKLSFANVTTCRVVIETAIRGGEKVIHMHVSIALNIGESLINWRSKARRLPRAYCCVSVFWQPRCASVRIPF